VAARLPHCCFWEDVDVLLRDAADLAWEDSPGDLMASSAGGEELNAACPNSSIDVLVVKSLAAGMLDAEYFADLG
jgi:hypothetical protein